MTPQPARSINVAARNTRDWLWTWGGACFGYRRENSLFTYDGLEVCRFSGTEVYGADGRYIGELSTSEDGPRLITNVYKKSRTCAPFTPDSDRPQKRQEARGCDSLYVGHEDFPSPEIAKRSRASRNEVVASAS
jgi:hypothetical protein